MEFMLCIVFLAESPWLGEVIDERVEPDIIIFLNYHAVNMPPRYLCLYRPVLQTTLVKVLTMRDWVHNPRQNFSALTEAQEILRKRRQKESKSWKIGRCTMKCCRPNISITLMKSQQQWLTKQVVSRSNHSFAPLIIEELLAIDSWGEVVGVENHYFLALMLW